MERLDFHKFIDDKPNIVIIVKLKGTNSIVVVYSEPMLSQTSQGVTNQRGAFLAVFDQKEPIENHKIFHLNKRNPQAVALPYNAYYLVVGNS